MKFINIFKYIGIFLLNFIKINPVKSVIVVLSIILLPLFGSWEDVRVEYKIEKKVELTGYKYSYIVTEKDDSGDISYDLYQSNMRPRFKDGMIIEYKFDEINVLFGGFYILLNLFIFIPIFFKNGDDGSYDISCVIRDTINYFIRCDVVCDGDRNLYTYRIGNRIIKETDSQIYRDNLANYFDLTTISSLLQLPKKENLVDKRKDILNRLGI